MTDKTNIQLISDSLYSFDIYYKLMMDKFLIKK